MKPALPPFDWQATGLVELLEFHFGNGIFMKTFFVKQISSLKIIFDAAIKASYPQGFSD